MTSESKSKGSSEPLEEDVLPPHRWRPFDADPSLTTTWEERDEPKDEDPDGPASIAP